MSVFLFGFIFLHKNQEKIRRKEKTHEKDKKIKALESFLHNAIITWYDDSFTELVRNGIQKGDSMEHQRLQLFSRRN